MLCIVADLRSSHPQQMALGTLRRRLVRFDSGNPRSEVPTVSEQPIFHVKFGLVQYVPLLEITMSQQMPTTMTGVSFNLRSFRSSEWTISMFRGCAPKTKPRIQACPVVAR